MSLPNNVIPADLEGGRCPSRWDFPTYVCESCGRTCGVEPATEDAYTLTVCEDCLPEARTKALQELVELRRTFVRLRDGIKEQLERAV